MKKITNNIIGYGAAAAQAILYSTLGIFGKLIYATGINSQQALFLRMGFTVVYLGAIMLIWRRNQLFSRNRTTYLQGVFFFISSWTYLLAVEHMNAGLVTCIFYTFPIVVAIMNAIVFHERITWQVTLALALSVLGTLCVSGVLEPSSVEADPLGIVFAAAASVSFATYSVMMRKTSAKESSFTSTFTVSTLALVMGTVLFAPQIPGAFHNFGLERFLLASGLSILATIVPIILFIVSIRLIGSTKASILSIIETPASLFLAWLILGETLTWLQFIGAACVFAAVLAVTLQRPSKS